MAPGFANARGVETWRLSHIRRRGPDGRRSSPVDCFSKPAIKMLRGRRSPAHAVGDPCHEPSELLSNSASRNSAAMKNYRKPAEKGKQSRETFVSSNCSSVVLLYSPELKHRRKRLFRLIGYCSRSTGTIKGFVP